MIQDVLQDVSQDVFHDVFHDVLQNVLHNAIPSSTSHFPFNQPRCSGSLILSPPRSLPQQKS